MKRKTKTTMPTRRDPARVKAVFTADIVGSTQHAPEETQWQLTSLISALDREVSWILHPEIYRGDSFQGVLASTEEMLRTAILARALMKQQGPKWDLRIAMGVGTIDRLTHRSGTSDGEAFRLSGQRIDKMKAERARIAIAFSRPSDPIDALLILVESVVEKWTPAQAGVIVKLLKGKTMSEAAKALNISQSAVSQHAQAAKWWAIEPVIKTFDQLLKPYYHHV